MKGDNQQNPAPLPLWIERHGCTLKQLLREGLPEVYTPGPVVVMLNNDEMRDAYAAPTADAVPDDAFCVRVDMNVKCRVKTT